MIAVHTDAKYRVVVGYQPCGGTCHGGHTTWQCLACDAITYAPGVGLACDAITYAPGVGAGCRLLDSAAFKR